MTKSPYAPKVIKTTDPYRTAADMIRDQAREAIAQRGRFTVALSGGSTPRAVHELLASDVYRGAIDWDRVHFFFGDERNVGPSNAESNYRMADESLLQPLSVPPSRIHRWPTELLPAAAAESYSETLRTFFGSSAGEFPEFDLILLGMGDDGHTASLFPETAALDEMRRIAVENWVEKLGAWRLTLTFPTINRARATLCLALGPKKAETLKKVIEGDFRPRELPIQSVEGLTFVIDAEAAALLSPDG